MKNTGQGKDTKAGGLRICIPARPLFLVVVSPVVAGPFGGADVRVAADGDGSSYDWCRWSYLLDDHLLVGAV